MPLTIKTVPIDSLVLDPANARKHPEKNLDAIRGSLSRFGQQKPIVIDSSNVVRIREKCTMKITENRSK